MKQRESEYLNKLFAPVEETNQRTENDDCFPLQPVPKGLTDKLYKIAETDSQHGSKSAPGFNQLWPKVTAIAASLLVVIVGAQFYQQQQTIKQLEQAQADLKTALHYLGQANRIARAEVLESVNENMRKAGIEPALEIKRDVEQPTFEKLEQKPQNRTL